MTTPDEPEFENPTEQGNRGPGSGVQWEAICREMLGQLEIGLREVTSRA